MTYNIDSGETKNKERNVFALPTVVTIVCGVVGLLLFSAYWTALSEEKWYLRLSGVFYFVSIFSIAIGLIEDAGLWSDIVQVECSLFLLIQYMLEVD